MYEVKNVVQNASALWFEVTNVALGKLNVLSYIISHYKLIVDNLDIPFQPALFPFSKETSNF